ncbi:MAG: PfkB family carbohydrate kinase [Pleurocapsa sp. MO_226.B13]|nr:PfkB family carbohydrate kinase [Pleurocapsa sp. MO_226.B13]
MSYQGLFVGLTTLDFIYFSDRYPQANQKVVAQDYSTTAGGPATNAAVAFSYFSNNRGRLLTVLGQHPLTQLMRSDLNNYPIEIVDLIPQQSASPPVSSIIVTVTTGERSVISINALKSQGDRSQIPKDILEDIDIILIDGHQIDVSKTIIEIAKSKQIPVVMDGGSWKPGLEKILFGVDYAICSANFYPPQCHNTAEVFDFLQARGISEIAITRGEQPIQYLERGVTKTISVPQIEAVDTLGAGDIFHGAFCHYILERDFATALSFAAQIASKSCQFFGTRNWLT